MCELFGMSTSRPEVAAEALAEFRLRGGLKADNPDGWGLAWWEDGAFHLAKEPLPACRSRQFEALCASARSDLIVAHVRKANYPPVNTLNNTHPFQLACCGKGWVFAHNGLVPEIVGIELEKPCPVCRPSGETDSEYAFCHLLGHISSSFDNVYPIDTPDSFSALAAASKLIASRGKFNFLLSDGEYLIAYGHDRLHYLERNGNAVDCVMVATEPLSGNEGWTAFEPGELRIYRAGRLVELILARPPVLSVPAHGRSADHP